MDFLAFLVEKLWQNKHKFIRGILTNSFGISYKICGLLSITWAPATPGSRSRALQIHIPA